MCVTQSLNKCMCFAFSQFRPVLTMGRPSKKLFRLLGQPDIAVIARCNGNEASDEGPVRVLQRSTVCVNQSRKLVLYSSLKVEILPLLSANDDETSKVKGATVELFGPKSKVECVNIKLQHNSEDFHVNVTTVGGENFDEIEKFVCKIAIPIHFDINVKADGPISDIYIGGFQNASVQAFSQEGNIQIKNVKSNEICLDTTSGSVDGKGELRGNVKITTVSGNVSVEKIIAPKASVQTKSGDVKCSALYATHSLLSTETGSVVVKSLHGDSAIQLGGKGNLTVLGVLGSLSATTAQGNAVVHISELLNNSIVKTKNGDVKLMLTDFSDIKIELEGAQLKGPESILGPTEGKTHLIHAPTSDKTVPSLKVVSDTGSIDISQSDWPSAFLLTGTYSKM